MQPSTRDHAYPNPLRRWSCSRRRRCFSSNLASGLHPGYPVGTSALQRSVAVRHTDADGMGCGHHTDADGMYAATTLTLMGWDADHCGVRQPGGIPMRSDGKGVLIWKLSTVWQWEVLQLVASCRVPEGLGALYAPWTWARGGWA